MAEEKKTAEQEKGQETELKKGSLKIHSENIFPIIKKWLYSEHDIFIRELISNSVDAMNKRKVLQPDLDEKELRIEVKIDKAARRIDVIDYGIGMDATEVKKYINQIAFSGAEEFIEKFKDKQSNIIGHFGLGFYSSFMVAEKVTIDTLSYKPKSKPAFWECDGSTDYAMGAGARTEVGTTVSIHVSKDNDQYLEESKLQEIIERFCNFMPFPIKLGDTDINLQEALWLRPPSEVKEEEYKEFYKKMFHEWDDPLFWIHLNADYPFNLKGILFFPKIRNDLDINRGQVKLYCNNVFVADNLKEFIPEFLLLLRGGIDVPDIPLNVSRSFLQQDQQVKKISKYIVKKVADHFKALFKEDRKKYEELWNDMNHFVKVGMLTNEDFFEQLKDLVVYKTSDDRWVTLEEYKEKNQTDINFVKAGIDETDERKSYRYFYSPGENSQVTYLKMMKEMGVEVIFTDSPLDTHLFQRFEMSMPFTGFARIDSELLDDVVDSGKAEVVDANNKTEAERVKDVFDKALDNKQITVEAKRLKSEEIASLVVLNEHVRRFQEMSMMMPGAKGDLLANHTLVVNIENPTVKKIIKLEGLGKEEDVKFLCKYLHQLALIEQKRFDGDELRSFLDNANKVLRML